MSLINKEIYEFENKFKVTLPECVKQDIYSIRPLSEIIYEMELSMKYLGYNLDEIRLFEDFPITMDMVKKMEEVRKPGKFGGYDIYFTLNKNKYLEENRSAEWFETDGLIKGWIPILSMGCSYETILVLSGELRGHVFEMNWNDGVQVFYLSTYEEWYKNRYNKC